MTCVSYGARWRHQNARKYSNSSVYELDSSSKTARKAKTRKTKINFREEAPGTTIGLQEEGARIRENWLVYWKTGINLCISYKRKVENRLLVYRGITVIRNTVSLMCKLSHLLCVVTKRPYTQSKPLRQLNGAMLTCISLFKPCCHIAVKAIFYTSQ
jgi:hypothetical protein